MTYIVVYLVIKEMSRLYSMWIITQSCCPKKKIEHDCITVNYYDDDGGDVHNCVLTLCRKGELAT